MFAFSDSLSSTHIQKYRIWGNQYLALHKKVEHLFLSGCNKDDLLQIHSEYTAINSSIDCNKIFFSKFLAKISIEYGSEMRKWWKNGNN